VVCQAEGSDKDDVRVVCRLEGVRVGGLRMCAQRGNKDRSFRIDRGVYVQFNSVRGPSDLHECCTQALEGQEKPQKSMDSGAGIREVRAIGIKSD